MLCLWLVFVLVYEGTGLETDRSGTKNIGEGKANRYWTRVPTKICTYILLVYYLVRLPVHFFLAFEHLFPLER